MKKQILALGLLLAGLVHLSARDVTLKLDASIMKAHIDAVVDGKSESLADLNWKKPEQKVSLDQFDNKLVKLIFNGKIDRGGVTGLVKVEETAVDIGPNESKIITIREGKYPPKTYGPPLFSLDVK